MPENFITQMAKYIAFLCKEKNRWKGKNQDVTDLFSTKIETALDICAMFRCRSTVWKESEKYYKTGEKVMQ